MSVSDDTNNVAPFHLLMSTGQPQKELLKHPSLQKDYFARRFKALHGDAPQRDIWSAVLPAERGMIECCEMNETRIDETRDETVVDGALMRSKEAPFVTLLARSCHSPSLRALGIAIMERTMEQDDWENSDYEWQKELGKESKKEASRMSRFLSAGGLIILKQWLIDAMTPVKQEIKQVSSGNEVKKRKALQRTSSPTGPLLLPLLNILKNIPFDRTLVTETKINKQIRNLKKALDDAMSNKRKGDQKFSDPVAGGLVVSQVQLAVDDLMCQWKESFKTTTIVAKDSFASLKEKMRERLLLLQEFEAGTSEKPAFLKSFEEAERLAKERKAIAKLSTLELEERERKLDRERLLQSMQQEKQAAQTKVKAKMEELRLKLREQSIKRQTDDHNKHVQPKRIVRWKDGCDHSDHVRQRSKLEEVFCYNNDDDSEDQNNATFMADSLLEVNSDIGGGLPLTDDDDDLWM